MDPSFLFHNTNPASECGFWLLYNFIYFYFVAFKYKINIFVWGQRVSKGHMYMRRNIKVRLESKI